MDVREYSTLGGTTKQPSKRELSRCRLLPLREFAEQINQRLFRPRSSERLSTSYGRGPTEQKPFDLKEIFDPSGLLIGSCSC